MLTALVVDDATAARHRVATLLQLAGWQVLEATDPAAAARAAARLHPDLVVTELRMRSGSGLALLRHLRRSGCRARFLLVTARPTARARARIAASGVPCLAKPVDARELIDFLRGRTTGPATPDPRPRLRIPAERVAAPAAPSADDEAGRRQRRQDFFLSALPHSLAMITRSAKAGDAPSVAAATQTPAGASGVVSQPRLLQLVTLASIAVTR